MITPSILAPPLSLPLEPLEERLEALLPSEAEAPQALHRAMRYAVFSGGKRIRPRLLLTVAAACAAEPIEFELALHAACSVEFIHSASLIHDDLPAFDDAHMRRGRPTVHVLFGEAIAILAGDALLTRAFEVLAEAPARLARRALRIVRLLGQATGSREGLIGGQGLEESPHPDVLDRYHAMKTAALFRVATEAGATAAGAADTAAWAEVGHCLGLAYQLADDLCDACGTEHTAGKPVRRDVALGRPNAVALLGEEATRLRLEELLRQARTQAEGLAVDPGPITTMLDELTTYFLRTTR
ncbi:MAG: polyprenyl synthetase family protein [Myxococcales bacterium]|nr:polyprenyl synthetase family protein [Myxococcota bacterium]MDW8282476.1 polyprenyl synthetase family protein [Myxococcales bacterium]